LHRIENKSYSQNEMLSAESEGQAVRRQLERILNSPGFSRNERLSGFLRFVVEGHLDGKDDELKESVIAVEVFGRRPDFDSRLDPVVRTEAVRLRARLSEYYINEGKADALIIELPKGGYVPRFREGGVEKVLQEAAPIPQAAPALSRTRFWIALGIPCFLVAIAAVGLWWILHTGAPITIAVLPLENTSHDPANEYFADGLTGELIRNLSIIDGLAVRSQTSSFALKGKTGIIREAGQQLQAEYILEGSVLRAGQQLRVNVQLIRVRDDFAIWSGQFDKELNDVFAIQNDIAVGIVNNLRLKVGRGRRRYETSVEAYDLYLHARAQPQRSRLDAQAIVGLYQQVVAKDASFAPAYAGLAAAYAAISFQGFRDHADDEFIQMRTAAEKAIALDPLLSEAHQALGMIYARDGQWARSEKSFRRAIEIDPANSLAYGDLTMNLLLPLGRMEEGVHQMRIAEKTDPLSPTVQHTLGSALLSTGRYGEAADHCLKAPEPRCLGRARLAQGRIDEAIQILATGTGLQYLGYAYGRAGRREQAEKFAADAAPNAFTQALTFAGLGDKERTLEALDRLASLGAVRVGRALNSPEFALLRDDPRVKALRKKVGLPQ
jgi:serine/threonine-protein kinase